MMNLSSGELKLLRRAIIILAFVKDDGDDLDCLVLCRKIEAEIGGRKMLDEDDENEEEN